MSWAYWPGVNGPARLDDRANIVQLNDGQWNLSALTDAIFSNQSGPLGRPVAMSSFFLEQWFWGAGTEVGKRVNIALHALNTILVFLVVCSLGRCFRLSSPRVSALIAAGLWCWSPLQVSTVLYHVQRMAILATFFMLLSIYCAIKARESFEGYSRSYITWTLLSVVSAILAVFSKENALSLVLLIPASLALCPAKDESWRSLMVQRYSALVFVTLLLILCVFVIFAWSWIDSGYSARQYSSVERILSQPRVLTDYARQFFLPDTARLGLLHDDFQLSSSMFSPVSTGISVLFFFTALVAAWTFRRLMLGRSVLLVLAFFFIGHSIESSVLALEPYFEHRNYFPSIGLALGFGFAWSGSLKCLPAIKTPLACWLFVYEVLLLVDTGAMAVVWSKHPLLVIHEINGHPDSPRANRAMAQMLAESGDVSLALMYVQRAYPGEGGQQGFHRVVFGTAMACISREELPGDFFLALKDYEGLDDRAVVEAMYLIVEKTHEGVCPDTSVRTLAERIEQQARENAEFSSASMPLLKAAASLENALERYDVALWYTERMLELDDADVSALLMNLHFCVAERRGDYCRRTKERLHVLDDQGLLNSSESETLALYQ